MKFPRTLLAAIVAAASAATQAPAFCINCPTFTQVEEFANESSGRHLWIPVVERERAEAGAYGPGWYRTGQAVTFQTWPSAPAAEVCRFHSPAASSWFFTANPEECAALKASGSGWNYETIAFKAYWPVGEACHAPMYRLRNDRWAEGQPSHRFTPDIAVRKRLLSAGWIDEGVAFCTDGASRHFGKVDWARTPVAAGAPLPQCEDSGDVAGTCALARNLPRLEHTIDRGTWNLPNARYDPRFDEVTGLAMSDAIVHTHQPPHDAAAVARGSYMQTGGMGNGGFGFHLVGRERAAGELATMAVIHRLATQRLSLVTPDERWMPWPDGRERELQLEFVVKIGGLRREGAGDHAYGMGVLRFQDVSTRRAFNVTLQALGTMPPGDFVGRDVASGEPIVSTALGPDAGFGFSAGARYLRCIAWATGSLCPVQPLAGHRFVYRMAREDFAKALEHARFVDPALSPDPARYAVSSFQFRAETFGNAEAGLSVVMVILRASP